jgi:DNA-directed RNA polymerase specialized sigma24 family protein
VVLARLFSNSTPLTLTRALSAYEALDRTSFNVRGPRRQIHRAKRLTPCQLTSLVEAYLEGATVYELADRLGIDCRTVSVRLKECGVAMRRASPTPAMVERMVHLYGSGLSAKKTGDLVGVSADTVLSHLHSTNVATRPPGRGNL